LHFLKALYEIISIVLFQFEFSSHIIFLFIIIRFLKVLQQLWIVCWALHFILLTSFYMIIIWKAVDFWFHVFKFLVLIRRWLLFRLKLVNAWTLILRRFLMIPSSTLWDITLMLNILKVASRLIKLSMIIIKE